LRHYDEVGLLSPAAVDPSSGYRRFRRGQLRQAWQIRVLRWIELPIEEIRQVLDDQAVAPELLARHRRRLEGRRGLLDAQTRERWRQAPPRRSSRTTPAACPAAPRSRPHDRLSLRLRGDLVDAAHGDHHVGQRVTRGLVIGNRHGLQRVQAILNQLPMRLLVHNPSLGRTTDGQAAATARRIQHQ
jgi:DNA-binding transcriptional MerR regulator